MSDTKDLKSNEIADEKGNESLTIVGNILLQLPALTNEEQVKLLISTCERRLNELHRIDLEKKITNALKQKYSNVVSLVRFANNFKIDAYCTYRTFETSYDVKDGVTFLLSLCNSEKCDDIKGKHDMHLVISGSFTKGLGSNIKNFNADYYITNDPRPETDIKYYMKNLDKPAFHHSPKTLCNYGTIDINDISVNDIVDKLNFSHNDINKKTYSWFGLFPGNENKLKSFLYDVLIAITL